MPTQAFRIRYRLKQGSSPTAITPDAMRRRVVSVLPGTWSKATQVVLKSVFDKSTSPQTGEERGVFLLYITLWPMFPDNLTVYLQTLESSQDGAFGSPPVGLPAITADSGWTFALEGVTHIIGEMSPTVPS